VADRVAVMYAGRLAELGSVNSIFHDTRHPYSRGLLRSVPNIDLDEQKLYTMDGSPASLLDPPPGCRFHPRCPDVMAVCSQVEPSFDPVAPGHSAACWLYQDHPLKHAARGGDGA
jgi:oligopeptide/dipeptide ABC transporter ATP-binding protein